MQAQIDIETVWGVYSLEEPVLEELIASKAMQRIKYIDQSGPAAYLNLCPKFSRYEHCLGVMVLLRQAGVSLVEQVAGLLHDVSHTGFSHLGDTLFYHVNGEKSYQDIIHLDFLKRMEVEKITEKYGIFLHQLDPDLEEYTALERPRPDLCADRIQYLIHTGVIFGAISKAEAKAIVNALAFEEGAWVFHDAKCAKQFAQLGLHFTKFLYNSGWDCTVYNLFEQALRRALQLELLEEDDIRLGTDHDLLYILYTADDEYIQTRIKACWNVHESFEVVEAGQGHSDVKPKFFGVDPLVKVDNNVVRLTHHDASFKEDYESMKDWCAQPYGLKYVV